MFHQLSSISALQSVGITQCDLLDISSILFSRVSHNKVIDEFYTFMHF